jgi:hypothetical protein
MCRGSAHWEQKPLAARLSRFSKMRASSARSGSRRSWKPFATKESSRPLAPCGSRQRLRPRIGECTSPSMPPSQALTFPTRSQQIPPPLRGRVGWGVLHFDLGISPHPPLPLKGGARPFSSPSSMRAQQIPPPFRGRVGWGVLRFGRDPPLLLKLGVSPLRSPIPMRAQQIPPPLRGRVGWGVLRSGQCLTPHPTLPHKGGGICCGIMRGGRNRLARGQ